MSSAGRTWGGQDNVWVGSQLSKLRLHGVSAHQHSQTQVCVARQLLHSLVQLDDQLACGRQYQS